MKFADLGLEDGFALAALKGKRCVSRLQNKNYCKQVYECGKSLF